MPTFHSRGVERMVDLVNDTFFRGVLLAMNFKCTFLTAKRCRHLMVTGSNRSAVIKAFNFCVSTVSFNIYLFTLHLWLPFSTTDFIYDLWNELMEL